ncbi:IS66-like element accessory protein TnpA [Defluviimonas salinarum]|uniref:Transposase n=1 Tax=Defluviimonas salinarum TaxID=2992147 RepID=A0ABT3J9S2_9RHOB|nr:transposase [Defluviimonas salinarum]MCW3784421.1 transposase [Defluviimonas salinarum]
MSQVEVLSVTDTGRRRRWADAEKLRIVEESHAAPRRAAATARRYEISRSLLTRWRREAREGLLSADGDRTHFAPVAVTPAPAPGPVAADVRAAADDTGGDRVGIILPNGHRLVTSATTEATVLARLIQIVERA